MVDNAGLLTFKTLAEWTGDDRLTVPRVDPLGAAFFTKQAFLHMAPERGGAIVNIDTPMLWDDPGGRWRSMAAVWPSSERCGAASDLARGLRRAE